MKHTCQHEGKHNKFLTAAKEQPNKTPENTIYESTDKLERL